jgi:hypothetical protein
MGLNWGLRGGMPATNRLSYGTGSRGPRPDTRCVKKSFATLKAYMHILRVFNCHNVEKYIQLYLKYLRISVTSIGNVSMVVFQQ